MLARACDELCSAMVTSVVIAGAIAVVATIWLLASRSRAVAVNRQRRRAGLSLLTWRVIRGSELSRDALAAGDADAALAAEAEVRRQIEWEKSVHAAEFLVHGRGVTRAWCAQHRRWCLSGDGGSHPPGGVDNPTAPPEFQAP